MRAIRATSALLFLFCILDLAQAQPGFEVLESVDSMITNADFVCTAKVKEFEEIVVVDNVGPKKFRVVFEVIQNMKSDLLLTHSPVRGFHIFSNSDELTRWQKQGSRLLVAADLENEDNNLAVELDATNPRVLTAEFQLLKNSESILRAVKRIIETTPIQIKRIHTFDLKVPVDVQSKMKSDIPLMLRIPADKRLEKKARTFLGSDSPVVRSQGVRAIRFFKTKENEAAARKLLADPFTRNEFDESRFVYPLRRDAYNLLRFWNVDVEKPVLRSNKESGRP